MILFHCPISTVQLTKVEQKLGIELGTAGAAAKGEGARGETKGGDKREIPSDSATAPNKSVEIEYKGKLTHQHSPG